MKTSFRSRPRLSLLLTTLWWAGSVSSPAQEKETIRIISLNMWGGGSRHPFDRTVAVIKESQADIAGLQETKGRAQKLAEALGWHCLDQGGGTAIISRFEITEATTKKWGAKLKLPSGRPIYVFNAHFFHAPFGPYQLVGISYHNGAFLKTADEAIQAAEKARGGEVSRMLTEVQTILSESSPILITGDFNEPSHLDWSDAAVKTGYCPIEVQWPTTKAVEAAGFMDTYRSVYPDPVKNPGLTWCPLTKSDNIKDRHERIDFIFAKGVTIKGAKIVGESKENADIVVAPYPSDHRAVLTELEY